MVKGPVEKVTCKEMVIAIEAMKSRKAFDYLKICSEMISASREVGFSFVMELCQH